MTECALRDAIAEFGRSIFDRGLTAGSSGNISVRMDDGWLLTPTNACLGRLDAARISKLDWEGRLLSGDPPSKEAPLHLAMYRQRAGAGAVVHLHSTYSAAVSCMRGLAADNCIPPLTAYYVMKIGRLPLVALSPARRSAARGCDWRPGGPAQRGTAGQSRSCGLRAPRSKRLFMRSRNWRKRRNCSCFCKDGK